MKNSMIKRIEELQKLVKSLSLSQEESEKILKREPIVHKEFIKKQALLKVSIAVITDRAVILLTEQLNNLKKFGEISLMDTTIARIVNIYGVKPLDLPKLEEIIEKIRKKLNK